MMMMMMMTVHYSTETINR